MRYENLSHETIGQDLLAALHTTKYPLETLGPYWLERLRTIRPASWYPVDTLLELQGQLVRHGGNAALVQLGRQVFRDSHLERLMPTLRSAGDVLFALDAMYRFANRGKNIGGWEVLRFGPGHATLRKTTPQHCALDEGFLYEALRAVDAEALIVQQACRLRGALWCDLELCSPVRDARWMGEHSPK